MSACRLLMHATVCGFLLAASPAAAQTRADLLLEQLKHPDGQVMVAAHRGDWRNAPENSLQAIENAIGMGVDIVEIDIRGTRDGQFVLMHDATLDRTTTGTGKVSHQTLAQVRGLYLRNGYGAPTLERVATLEEALELARGRVLVYLDKSEEVIPEAYAVAKRLGCEKQVLFYGERTHEQLVERLGELSAAINYLPKLGDATERPQAYIEGFAGRMPAFVTSFARDDSPVVGRFADIERLGARVWASPLWPELCGGRTDDLAIDDPDAAWGWLISRGATVLCTDRPRELMEYLRERGLHE